MLLLTMVLACTGPEPADACLPGGEATLSLGTGESRYTSLGAVDHELELIHGPQGGVHLIVALEATHLDGSELVAAQLSGSVDGIELARSDPWLDLRCNPATRTLQSWGALLIFDAEPEEVVGRTSILRASVQDVLGNTATAEATVSIIEEL